MLAPRLPFPIDPLIAEAKRRMRRRRFLLLAIVVAAATALGFPLRPSGGVPPSSRPLQEHNAHPPLTRLTVPLDKSEREWRQWVALSNHGIGEHARSATVVEMQRRISAAVVASGARVVRLKVWDVHWGTPVELVVATAVQPAVYLRHRLARLLGRIHGGYRYVQVVDPHGTRIFENYYRTRGGHFEGSIGVPPALQACSPVFAWGEWAKTPCPMK